MPIIGLTGRKESGKDTFYKLVLAPRGFERRALADPLKTFVLHEQLRYVQHPNGGGPLDYTLPELYALKDLYTRYLGSRKDPEVRQKLQEFGTDVVRKHLDPGFWLAILLADIRDLHAADPNVCVAVTDVRYPNEAYGVRGDAASMRLFYEGVELQGQPFDPLIRHALTHTWDHDDAGLLPPPGLGVIIRIKRPDLAQTGAATQHESETSVDRVPTDHTFLNRTPAQVARQGGALIDGGTLIHVPPLLGAAA